MHYRNGREAKNGDKIIQLDYNSGKVIGVGVLFDAQAGNDFCNGKIAPLPLVQGPCLCDCLNLDDLEAILAERGLNKRPAGK